MLLKECFQELERLGCHVEVREFGELACERCGVSSKEFVEDGLCYACDEELTLHEKIVSEGGVYWECEDCPAMGVIRESEFAAVVRKKVGVEAPHPAGIMFTTKDCPACSDDAVIEA